MIQFEKINEKGDKLKAYTHKNYLSKQYHSEICKKEKRNQTIVNLLFYGTSIISYWALNNVAGLNKYVEAKFSIRGRFLILSALVGAVDSFVASLFLNKSLTRLHQSLLKKEVFPAWLQKQKVINPDRVYFELDDNNNNEPTIWHSGISHQAIQRLVPDFIVGNPLKPLLPVAEVHH